MAHPVFISYARDASREHALALHQALGGETAFLDTDAIPLGESFPKTLVDALFDAQVVVIFAEPHYFTRWYCLLEFRIARTPFLRAMARTDIAAREREDALRGLVVAMPPRGVNPMMDRFPPLVAVRNWPDVGDIDRIAEFVIAELATNPPTLRERYALVGDADAARRYVDTTRLPSPAKIGNIPFVPQIGLPTSIGDAFVGRADDLWRIHDLLWTERGDPATAAGLTGAIEATGGFGKTRLALEYLYRFGPRHFKGGLFWINAESDPELQLYEVLQALNPAALPIEAVRETPGGVPGALARAIRSRPDDAPTPLFIIDNVPEPEPAQPPKPLETWCPVLGEVPVLTTSRTRITLGTGGGVVALPIETLDPASAVQLLTTETQRVALKDAEWNEIAEWVGYLPLALEVLNRLIRSGGMTARMLLEFSREQTPSAAIDAAMESIRNVVPAGALRGITEAFSASYNLLAPEEQYAARLIAWMAPAPVPAFVIEAFGPEVFAPGVRAKLISRSFVTQARAGADGVFGAMHRVLGDFIRGQTKAREEEVTVVSSLLTTLMESAEGHGAKGSLLVRDCAPLVSAVFHNWIAEPMTETNFSEAGVFANDLGTILAQWGYLALAGDLFASLAATAEQRLGFEHRNTLASMHNLAITRRDRGDLAGAQELFARVLEARRRILGDEHPDTLITIDNLATTQWRSGDRVGGLELQEHVLEASRARLGEEHPATLRAMHNLALTLFGEGDFHRAQELQEHVLATRQRTLGDEHTETLMTMNNLVLTRRGLGDDVGAQKLQEQVLQTLERRLGLEHPLTTVAAWLLLEIYFASGDFEAADHLFAENLLWLLERDPASLTEQQRMIQAKARERIGRESA
jgi:tetratricopeptide (TPR) repeat protein